MVESEDIGDNSSSAVDSRNLAADHDYQRRSGPLYHTVAIGEQRGP